MTLKKDEKIKGICGDCTNTLTAFPDEYIDAVITDPPYLVNYTDRTGRTIKNDKSDSWLLPAFKEIYRVLKPNSYCVCFYGWNKVDRFLNAWKKAGFKPVSHFVCVKHYASSVGYSRSHHEQAYLLAKGNPDKPAKPPKSVIRWGKYTHNVLHPTQKPEEVIQAFVEAFTQEGDVILDPFAGSGTTAVVAKKLGRRCIWIECAKEHYQTALSRVSGKVGPSNNQTNMTKNHPKNENQPLEVYTVIEVPQEDGTTNSDWKEIEAPVVAHKDGKGFNILFPLPIGKIVLREPREKKETNVQAPAN